MLRRALLRLFAALAALALALVCGDLAVSLAGLDREMIAKVLYYQNADVPAHEPSPDPILHYVLRPGATHTGRNADAQDATYDVSINSLGARSPEFPREAPEGGLRILVFGGSTIYGSQVSDDETIPARLQVALSERLGPERPVEVWNFGTSAYVRSQMARLAQLKTEEIPGVDLVLMVVTNAGRRAFLQQEEPVDFTWYADRDPYLYPENFPTPKLEGVPPHLMERIHLFGLYYLASWRYYAAWQLGQTRAHTRNQYTFALGNREMQSLEGALEARGIPMLYVNYPRPEGPMTPPPGVGEERLIELYRPGQPAAFYEIHPPPLYLDQHAKNLAEGLLAGGHVQAPAASPGGAEAARGGGSPSAPGGAEP